MKRKLSGWQAVHCENFWLGHARVFASASWRGWVQKSWGKLNENYCFYIGNFFQKWYSGLQKFSVTALQLVKKRMCTVLASFLQKWLTGPHHMKKNLKTEFIWMVHYYPLFTFYCTLLSILQQKNGFSDIFQKIKGGSFPLTRPQVCAFGELPPQVQQVFNDSMGEIPTSRPSFSAVLKTLHGNKKYQLSQAMHCYESMCTILGNTTWICWTVFCQEWMNTQRILKVWYMRELKH